MTLTDLRSKLKALQTMHSGTRPSDARHLELFMSEAELIKALDALLAARLNLRLEQQKAEVSS